MKHLYSRYFPTPSYLAMTSCALDISDQSIKYGELLPTPHGLRLGRFGEVKIPSSVVISGRIENDKELIDILKKLKAREHLRFVRISLPEEQMYIFTLSLPHIEGGDLRDTILLQLEEHIPLSVADTIFDYDVVSETAQTIVVEVTAVSAAIIDSYLSVCEQTGLVPVSFELEAQAIARAVIKEGDSSTVMIVDFGETRTGVSIASSGRMLFTTTLDVGGQTLTEMIAKGFQVSLEEAEKMKRSYEVGDTSNPNDVFSVVLSGISVLRDELNKHYIYWKTHEDEGVKHEPIDRIILCGGAANLNGLLEYLATSMKLKVEYANAWMNISTMDISVPTMPFEQSLGYVTMLGLALGDYVGPGQPIVNVLPPEEKKALRKDYRKRLASASVTLLALMGALGIALILPAYFFSASKLALAEQRLEEFDRQNPEITTRSLDATVGSINTRLDTLKKITPTSFGETILKNLLANRSSGITFSQILYSESATAVKTLEVHGVATDRTTLRVFKSALDADPAFKEVRLPNSDFLERSNINFAISITLK